MNAKSVFTNISQIRCDMEYGNKNVKDLNCMLKSIVRDLEQYKDMSCTEFMTTVNPDELSSQTNTVMEEFYWQTWLIASRFTSLQKMYNHPEYLDLFYKTFWIPRPGEARFSIKWYIYDLEDFWLRMRKISELVDSNLSKAGYKIIDWDQSIALHNRPFAPVQFKYNRERWERSLCNRNPPIDLVDAEIQDLKGYCPFNNYNYQEDYDYYDMSQKLAETNFQVFYDRISELCRIITETIDITEKESPTETLGQKAVRESIDQIILDPLIFHKPM